MCGIVGYVGPAEATARLLAGLEQLAYRGYDSAGIAVLSDGQLARRRAAGKLSNLRDAVAADPLRGAPGIGHTRWATHGDPTRENAHPHFSMAGDFAVVHNGIVENYLPLRAELADAGVCFQSQTDSEIIVQLIAHYAAQFDGDGAAALAATAERLAGAGAIVLLSRLQPDRLFAARLGNAGGITLGIGEDGGYLASDIPALLPHTRELVFLEDGQLATLRAERIELRTLAGAPLPATTQRIAWDPLSASRGRFKHFMQKEIFEQPRSIADTLGGRIDLARGEVLLPELALSRPRRRGSCGASSSSPAVRAITARRWANSSSSVGHACRRRSITAANSVIVNRRWMSTRPSWPSRRAAKRRIRWPRWRKRVPALRGRKMHVPALRGRETRVTGLARGRPCSGASSTPSVARRSAWPMLVCSCARGRKLASPPAKTFTASIVTQQLLALALAGWRGTLSVEARAQHLRELSSLPALLGEALRLDDELRALAGRLHHHQHFLYLGRGALYPIALEGALKLKEISYIHAEGYPAGEMKHGPIALLDEKMPSLLLALQNGLYEKVLSQLAQLRARAAGRVVALGTVGDLHLAEQADEWIALPPCEESVQPLLATVPLQLLAYHIAVHRGADVDQPRNLAKSVTVE